MCVILGAYLIDLDLLHDADKCRPVSSLSRHALGMAYAELGKSLARIYILGKNSPYIPGSSAINSQAWQLSARIWERRNVQKSKGKGYTLSILKPDLFL